MGESPPNGRTAPGLLRVDVLAQRAGMMYYLMPVRAHRSHAGERCARGCSNVLRLSRATPPHTLPSRCLPRSVGHVLPRMEFSRKSAQGLQGRRRYTNIQRAEWGTTPYAGSGGVETPTGRCAASILTLSLPRMSRCVLC